MKTKKFKTKSEDIQGIPTEDLEEQIPERYKNAVKCDRTGRIMTEWFEAPHLTDEDIKQMALDAAGLSEPIHKMRFDMTDEEKEQFTAYNKVLASKRNTKFKGGMSKQEVQVRMNEASKLIDPNLNPKFLDKATQDKFGLELNPMWQMEALARSGRLSAKDELAAWAKLAEYTHSKAATITETNTKFTLEDYLNKSVDEQREAIEAEYTVVQIEERTITPAGMSEDFNRKQAVIAKTMDQASELTSESIEALAEELGDFDIREYFNNEETEPDE